MRLFGKGETQKVAMSPTEQELARIEGEEDKTSSAVVHLGSSSIGFQQRLSSTERASMLAGLEPAVSEVVSRYEDA